MWLKLPFQTMFPHLQRGQTHRSDWLLKQIQISTEEGFVLYFKPDQNHLIFRSELLSGYKSELQRIPGHLTIPKLCSLANALQTNSLVLKSGNLEKHPATDYHNQLKNKVSPI